MERNEILEKLTEALRAIIAPRFYETERGFQGELLVQLGKRLALPDQVIIEQEHQKRAAAHGLTCRPDIIVHAPFNEIRHEDRSQGNHIVIELKVRATSKEATEDFESLGDMIETLKYPLGIFINIGSEQTYRELVPEGLKDRIVVVAVALRSGAVQVVR